MSKIYDDLKRSDDKEGGDNLDLFAYAAQKAQSAPSPVAPPPAEPEPSPAELDATPSPVEPELAPPVADIQEPPPKIEPAKYPEPLYRGLSPLTGVRPPPHESDRRAVIIAALAVCGLLVLALLVVGIVRGLSRAKPAVVAESTQQPVDATEPADVMPAPREVQPVEVVAKPVELGGKGMVVTTEGSEKLVVFESGVFSSGAKLSREGEAILSNIGRQLSQRANTVLVTVVGCTDNVPVSGKGGYKSNEELGLMRAAAAQRILQSSSGLPSGAFKTVSYGAKWSPFPNDTAANRTRNRTVVLRVTLR